MVGDCGCSFHPNNVRVNSYCYFCCNLKIKQTPFGHEIVLNSEFRYIHSPALENPIRVGFHRPHDSHTGKMTFISIWNYKTDQLTKFPL